MINDINSTNSIIEDIDEDEEEYYIPELPDDVMPVEDMDPPDLGYVENNASDIGGGGSIINFSTRNPVSNPSGSISQVDPDTSAYVGRTYDEIVDQITDDFIEKIDKTNHIPENELASELLKKTIEPIDAENSLRQEMGKKRYKINLPKSLDSAQITSLMGKLYDIIVINCNGSTGDPDTDLLAFYASDGPDKGTYRSSEIEFFKLAVQFKRTLSDTDFKNILKMLRATSPRRTRTMDKDLIAVNNGIFNYKTKKLEPFDPNYVFLAKSKVDYNPSATNVVIHNDSDGTNWDVESWMRELSDDPEIVMLLWEILSAIIRPHVRWNKSAWFYSSTGNNGKGTLCELMRSLCGDGSYAAIPLSNFGKDFALEPLTRSTAIIVDENDVGTFIDKAANLKAVITNDVIPINRKFKTHISYQFYGFMVQCLNEFPRIKDKSDSFYRRQLFIPFEKCFTGKERKYIKNDYLHRKEVLEYVLYRALHVNVYKLSEPEACRAVMNEFKENNDPVRQFMNEFSSQFVWDLLPFSFLYDLFKVWFKKNNPNGSILGRNTFIADLTNILEDYPDWYCDKKSDSIRPAHRMDAKEYLIWDYNLLDWQDPYYSGTDKDKICNPKLKDSYTGLKRRKRTTTMN